MKDQKLIDKSQKDFEKFINSYLIKCKNNQLSTEEENEFLKLFSNFLENLS